MSTSRKNRNEKKKDASKRQVSKNNFIRKCVSVRGFPHISIKAGISRGRGSERELDIARVDS